MGRILPILFNTEMVRAILEGRKTVTRRLVKPQQMIGLGCDKCPNNTPEEYIKQKKMLFKPWCDMADNELIGAIYKSPCQPGDILYVRETWRVGAWDIRNQMIAFDYKDGTCGKLTYIRDRELFERLVNQSREDARKAGCEYNGVDFVWEKGKSPCRWRPSIHMPKEAARIFLKVKDVRVERLQDITEEQALKEGVPDDTDYPIDKIYCPRCQGYGLVGALSQSLGFMEVDCHECDTAVKRFNHLWNSTIKKSDLALYGWNVNPYVWVIEFERCEKPAEF